MILAKIAAKYDTPLEFTEQIRLVLLLLPPIVSSGTRTSSLTAADMVVILRPVQMV